MTSFDSHSALSYSALFDELWPICRSISGTGLRESLGIFSRYMALDVEGVDSGTQVFDWTVPDEWNIRSAVLTGPDGRVVADMEENNLHVLNYSEPVDRTLSLEELQPHLFSIPDQPDLIPYVTSYYQRRWGFCISEKTRKTLGAGKYRAVIDSDLSRGEVSFGTAFLEGEEPSEVLLTSYLCHPSMANNELSGPWCYLDSTTASRPGPNAGTAIALCSIPKPSAACVSCTGIRTTWFGTQSAGLS